MCLGDYGASGEHEPSTLDRVDSSTGLPATSWARRTESDGREQLAAGVSTQEARSVAPAGYYSGPAQPLFARPKTGSRPATEPRHGGHWLHGIAHPGSNPGCCASKASLSPLRGRQFPKNQLHYINLVTNFSFRWVPMITNRRALPGIVGAGLGDHTPAPAQTIRVFRHRPPCGPGLLLGSPLPQLASFSLLKFNSHFRIYSYFKRGY